MEWKTFKIANYGKSKTIKAHWQVSDIGQIRVYYPHNETIRWPHISLSGGHPGKRYSCLSSNDFKYVHRIVASQFVENPNGYATVDHIDGNPQNNRANNLQWISNADNIRKAKKQML